MPQPKIEESCGRSGFFHSERASKPNQNYETKPIPSFVFNKNPKWNPISRQTYLWAADR
jgi:hypothetical protein